MPPGLKLEVMADRALLALQGPAAGEVIARLSPEAGALGFMSARSTKIGPFDCHVSRSGYTGEDGFEISVRDKNAVEFAKLLLPTR